MKAPLSVLLGLLFLIAPPSSFAEDPGWHSGRVVSIHTNGLHRCASGSTPPLEKSAVENLTTSASTTQTSPVTRIGLTKQTHCTYCRPPCANVNALPYIWRPNTTTATQCPALPPPSGRNRHQQTTIPTMAPMKKTGATKTAVRLFATTAAQLTAASATSCPSPWQEAPATMAACTASLGQFGERPKTPNKPYWNAALAHAPSCFEQHDDSNSALPTRSHRMAPNIGARPSQTSTSLETTLRTVAKTPSTTQSRLVKRRAIGTARFIVPTLAVPTTLEVEDNGK